MAAPVTLHLWAGWPHVLRAQQFDPPALERVFREAQLAEEADGRGSFGHGWTSVGEYFGVRRLDAAFGWRASGR